MNIDMRQWWVVPGPDGGKVELRQVDRPPIGPSEALVKIAAAGVNRGELIGRRNGSKRTPPPPPYPSGIEFAGKIVEAGGEVRNWSKGQRVMGRGGACHATYAVVDARQLMPVPESMDDALAASIPNVFVTAHDAIVTNARLCPAERVLITAGSSGVGAAAVQIARYLGAAEIVATTRDAAKSDRLKALGATVVLDTSIDSWPTRLREETGAVNVVIDQVGGRLFPDLLQSLDVQGRYLSVGRNDGPTAAINLDLLALNRLHLIGATFRTRSKEEALACSERFVEDLLPAFDQGKLAPVLDRSFPFAELPAAHAYMETDRQVGKIVLTA